MSERTSCASCFMPFQQDPGKREHPDYCSLCYRDGKLSYEGDWEGFRQAAYDGMVGRGMNKYKACFFAWMTKFAPRWRAPKK